MFLLPAPTVPTLLITPLLRTSDGSHFSVLTLSLSSRRFGLLMIPQARQVCFRAFALAILPQLLPHTCVSLHFSPPAGIGSHPPVLPMAFACPLSPQPMSSSSLFIYLFHLLSVSTHWTVSSVGDWLPVVFVLHRIPNAWGVTCLIGAREIFVEWMMKTVLGKLVMCLEKYFSRTTGSHSLHE